MHLRYLSDQLAPLGAITSRAMFGGFALYANGKVFAIGDEDAIYLRGLHPEARQTFTDLGWPQFTYPSKGRTLALRYYLLPAEAVDERLQLLQWARLALLPLPSSHKRRKKKKPPARPRKA